MERIGVIGLGRMGSAIARRMQAQGCAVAGWTRSGAPVDGISAASDLISLAANSDTLILSLFDDAAVGQVLDALLKVKLAGKLIVETSTVAPMTLQGRAKALAKKGAMAVDAPISGGPELVLAGSCGIYLGGDDAAATRTLAAIAPLTKRVFHMGPLGAGLVMKTINNGMLQAYFRGLHDLLPLAKRAGLSLERTLEVLCAGPAGIPMLTARLPKVLGEDPSVGFSVTDVHKDNTAFQRVLQDYCLTAPVLELSEAQLQEAITNGLGDLDIAAVIRAAFDQA